MIVTDAMLEELPRSLSTFWVEAAIASRESFQGTFKRLPSSLKALHLRSCHSLVAPRFENLPSTLQVLGEPSWMIIIHQMLRSFEQTLVAADR